MPLHVGYIPVRYRCCGFFHVRVGTLLLAIGQIIIHLLVIAFTTALIGRALVINNEAEYVTYSLSVMSFIQWEWFVSESDKFMPIFPKANSSTSMGTHDDSGTVYSIEKPKTFYLRAGKFLNAGEEYVSVVITLFSLFCCMLLLVGVIYGRPFYILPYCCIQFLDLFVTCLSVVGYYTYVPDDTHWSKPRVWLSSIVIITGVVLLGVKAYLLSMVWLCYKYILHSTTGFRRMSGFSFTTRMSFMPFCFRNATERVGPCRDSCPDCATSVNGSQEVRQLRNQATRSNGRSEMQYDRELCLPPKYEDAIAMPKDAFGPPPYSIVTKADDLLTHPEVPKCTTTI